MGRAWGYCGRVNAREHCNRQCLADLMIVAVQRTAHLAGAGCDSHGTGEGADDPSLQEGCTELLSRLLSTASGPVRELRPLLE